MLITQETTLLAKTTSATRKSSRCIIKNNTLITRARDGTKDIFAYFTSWTRRTEKPRSR